jgi:DNA repair ATPase RecN
VPDEIRAEVRQAAIVELSLRWRVACDRLARFERRVAARAHILDAYKQEHHRLTDRVERLNRAIAAAQRLP